MTVRPTKNAKKSTDTRFKLGNPGGPGRPTGSRNAATLLLDQLAEGDAQAEIVLSRVWPVRKGRPVTLAIPPITTAADIVAALGAVANAMAAGEITPDEAASVASVLEVKRRSIETADLAARIEAIEKGTTP